MIHAVVMAGGKGTRFWPLSRAKNPKQFLSILTAKSLLEETISRVRPLIPKENTWIVGSVLHQRLLAGLSACVPLDQILSEPVGRNTAASIGWAASEIIKKDPDAVLVVLPSDHFISSSSAFRTLLKKAAKVALTTESLVTIGIRPTMPHTGYGYIEAKSVNVDPAQVLAFHEKPSFSKAQTYIKSGRFFWNSGIFVWKASTILSLIAEYMPTHYKLLKQLSKFSSEQPEFIKIFKKFESISIDYGVMEHSAAKTKVLFSTFDWNDIGSWSALDDFLEKDLYGNAISGQCFPLDSTGNIVVSKTKVVSLVDVHDMIIVDTEDAILVMPKSSDQKIKQLYEVLPPELQ